MARAAPADEPAVPLPSFAELESAGARVGEIRIAVRDIFDTSDPKEDNWLFRTANKLHIQTRPSVIQRQLLFASGEPVSARLIEETERLLRSNRYLYDVQFRPVAVHDGVVDIELVTRDTWSLDPGFSAGRSGGVNSSGIRLKEYNLLGTGTSVSFGRSNNVDRSSNEFQFSNDRAFGTWTALSYSLARNSDGRRDAASVVRPFYALDDAAGMESRAWSSGWRNRYYLSNGGPAGGDPLPGGLGDLQRRIVAGHRDDLLDRHRPLADDDRGRGNTGMVHEVIPARGGGSARAGAGNRCPRSGTIASAEGTPRTGAANGTRHRAPPRVAR